MQYAELEAQILSILPDAELEEDEYGECIVRTHLHETLDGEMIPF